MMRIVPIAAILAASLLGVPPPGSVAQEPSGTNRADRIERRIDEAEDVIVEEVLAMRRRMESLELRVRVLEQEVAALRGGRTPPP